jgi:hypothetical protein
MIWSVRSDTVVAGNRKIGVGHLWTIIVAWVPEIVAPQIALGVVKISNDQSVH